MGVLSGYATRLTIAQRTLYDRLRSQGIEDAVARQLAVAIEKSQPLKKRKRATSEAYARSYAAEAKKFLDPLYSRHVHSQAMARAGGIVSGQNRRAAREQAIADATALAAPEAIKKGNKPMGAAFSHARASGEDQSHEARKKRANRYLRNKGHKPIGKALWAAIALSKGGPGSGRYPAGSHNNGLEEEKKNYGVTSSGKNINLSLNPSSPYSNFYEHFSVQDFKEAAQFARSRGFKEQDKEFKKLARFREKKDQGQLLGTTESGKPIYLKTAPDHPSRAKFNSRDHFDAAQKYNSEAKRATSVERQDILRQKAEVHLQAAAKTMRPNGAELLPQHKQDALHAYTGHTVRGPDYRHMNNALRGRNPYNEDQTEAIVHAANLQAAIGDSPLEKDTTFYRGSQAKAEPPKIGDIISTPGFLSVSEKPRIARAFARPKEDKWGDKQPSAIFTIHAPAGTKVLDVNKHLFGIHAHEKEHIFGSDQAFRVKSVRTETQTKGYKSNIVHHVELETVPSSPHGASRMSKSTGKNDTQFTLAHPNAAKKRLTSNAGFRVVSSAVEKCCRQAIALAKMGPLPGEFTTPEFMETQRTGRRRKKKGKDRQPFSLSGTIVKSISKPWQRLVYSIVYEPDTVDLHGDFMDAATIEKAAHASMRSGIYVNHEHGPERLGAHVVESYVAPCDMTIPSATGNAANIKKGTWVMGLKIEDAATWDRILDGTYQGFSLEGSGIAQTLAA